MLIIIKGKVDAIGTNRLTAERKKMGINEINNVQLKNSLGSADREKQVNETERTPAFSKILENKQQKCPYDYLAKDGVIEYNGVTFVCDYKRNAICLGDVDSNPKEVLKISLPSGGTLKVNIHNFGDLSKAAGMFTPEDLNAIMRAISQYNHCTSKLNELDEEEEEIVEDATEEEETQNKETEDEVEEQTDIFKSYEYLNSKVNIMHHMRTYMLEKTEKIKVG